MTRVRWLLAGLGVLAGGYGAWLLLTRQQGSQLWSAAEWLVAGVVLHDFVLTPVVLLVVAAGARALPPTVRVAATVGLVVLGTVTLVAVPVLGRFGARADNPSLLDRHYWLGWLAVAGLVLLGVLVAVARRRRDSVRR